MALVSWAKKEFARLKLQNPKRISLPQASSLAPVNISAATSEPVKDVELAIDLRCANCQKRIATVISNIDEGVRTLVGSNEVYKLFKKNLLLDLFSFWSYN